MLEPIEFPTRPESCATKAFNAIAKFERHHPVAAMVIAWAALGLVLVASAIVNP